MLRFRDELHLPDHARSIVAAPPATPASARPKGWSPKAGDRVSVMSWRDVPVGGDPYRGTGTVEYVENGVAVVRLDDRVGERYPTSGFNVGDVSPLEGA